MSAETNDHREWLESAALFALDALAGDDRRAFDAHRAACRECQSEVARLRAVSTALAYAVPQIDPPPALRTRVLAAALGSAGADGAAPRHATHDAPRRSWLALAAALMLLVVGLGAYAYSLRAQLASMETALNTARWLFVASSLIDTALLISAKISGSTASANPPRISIGKDLG